MNTDDTVVGNLDTDDTVLWKLGFDTDFFFSYQDTAKLLNKGIVLI